MITAEDVKGEIDEWFCHYCGKWFRWKYRVTHYKRKIFYMSDKGLRTGEIIAKCNTPKCPYCMQTAYYPEPDMSIPRKVG